MNCAAASRASNFGARARHKRRASVKEPRRESCPQAPAGRRLADRAGGRHRLRTDGVRIAAEHDVPLFAERSRSGPCTAACPFSPGRRGEGRQHPPRAGHAHHRFHRDRPLPRHARAIHRHPARPVPRRAERDHNRPHAQRRIRRQRSAGQARRDLHAQGSGRRDRQGEGRAPRSRKRARRRRAMIPELGQLALIIALLLSALQCALPVIGAWRDNRPLMATARSLAVGQFVFVALAFGILTYAFLVQDFSVAYVAQNSNLQLPWWYRFPAVWGAHEGSLLLWVFILDVWTLAVAALGGKLPEGFHARVLGVLGFVAFGFLLFSL